MSDQPSSMLRVPVAVIAGLVSLLVPIGAHGQAVTAVTKRPDGVVITLGRQALELLPLAPDVIRVRSSATGTFAPQRVPVLIAHDAPPAFHVTDRGGWVIVATARLSARVDRHTGALSFFDPSGRPITAEIPGTRSLTAAQPAGATSPSWYKAEDKFMLAAGEAIYGLGQHQEGHLDYRGSRVVLEQVNREVGIPFLVSSRGYGLLWNNASHTEISVAADEETVPASALVDDQGQPGGLTGHYFQGRDFEQEVATHKDGQVDFNWDFGGPGTLGPDDYSVRWTGSVQADRAGTYTFETAADDGVRLWIDGTQVIDDWSTHAVTVDNATIRFDAGTRHTIRLEYFQAGGGASVRLSWSKPTAQQELVWTSEAADNIDYVVFYGPSLDRVIQSYRHETGEAPLIPKWALGYWQSKERYQTQQELIDIATEYRQRRDPIDNIVQDWYYWAPYPWGSHKFDPARYPDPAAAFKTLHDDHFHVMISVWGKFDPGTADNPDANYDAMNAKGYLYPQTLSWPEQYYDAFNPAARALYWEQMRDDLFTKGIDAWWLDASEPEVNMEGFRNVPTAAGPGALVLNAWPLMHTTAVHDGQTHDAPNKRVFILTRSAYAGQQRNGAATWSGDITATWNVFTAQIPAGLNFCLSGIPYWTTDIGAFNV